MSNRLDQEREAKLQPLRMEIAIKSLIKLGVDITYKDETKLKFFFKGKSVTFFPYSGWHSGKGIKPGRGLKNLLNQI